MLSTIMIASLCATAPATIDPSTLPDFMSPADKVRICAIQRGRMLFGGQHRQYFLREARTQHNFPIELVGEKPHRRYVTINMIKLALTKVADLICLQPPVVKAPDGHDAQDEAFKRIDRDSGFASTLYEAALTCSFELESFWQVYIRNDLGTPTGGAIIGNVPADWCFPDRSTLKPNGTYGRIVKQWVVPAPQTAQAPGTNGAPAQNPIMLLRRETHEAGKITNELFQLSARGAIERKISLSQLPETADLPDVQMTGVDMPLLQCVAAIMLGGNPVDELEDKDALADQVNASASQISRVLAKHADPKIAFPEQMIEEGQVRATHDAVPMTPDGKKPEYIVWNAELDAAFKQQDGAVRDLLITLEVAPRLVGISSGGAPESYKKLKLEIVQTLAKVSRRLLTLDRATKDIILTAHAAENAMVPGLSYEFAEPSLAWQNGLPTDDLEESQTVLNYRNAGAMSLEDAVRARKPNEQEASEEVDRINSETQAALPPNSLMAGDGLHFGAAG